MKAVKVMIVEDEAVIAMDIRYHLEQFGYEVVGVAAAGDTALQMLDLLHPDVVIMDIHIRGPLDGIHAAHAVRVRAGTPVIFLTAFSDDETLGRARETAPYGFLVKPFRPDELRASIEVALFKHQMEKRLKQSELWFAKTLSCISDGVVATDPAGRVKFVNPAAESATGWTSDEALGRDVAEVVVMRDEETGIALRNPARHALESRAASVLDAPALLVSQTGLEILIDDSAAPILGDDGELMGAVLILRDVTARRHVEKRLLESEERFHSAFDHAAIGMALVSVDGRFLQVNHAIEEILGYSRAELLTRTLREVGWDDESEAALEQRNHGALLATDIASFQMERRFAHKDGAMLWTLLGVSVVRDAARAPLYLVAQITDVTSRRKAEERLTYLAGHDDLTGAMNRLQLVESLGRSIANSRRQAQRVAALVLDLDGFKLVNDSMGHMVGDLVLQDVARRLKTLLPATDHLARLGGDEFVLILNGIDDREHIARVAQKIIEAVSQPQSVEGQEILLTASVGVSVCPDDSDSVEGMLKNADDAMYRAKELGKNNYQFYTSDMTTKAVQRLRIERDLRGALAASAFVLHYQPILKSGRVVAIEALLRWNHAEMGLLEADRFVLSAEETGLIVPIGRWVMLQACAQMQAWHDAGVTDARIAVNLSARQFRDPDLLRTITDALAQTGLAPDCLELEITESSIMHDREHTIGILRRLREIGVHVSVDDFGTSHSSLSYLKRFPLDGLKVDRSFIKDFPLDPDGLAIVQAIIAMARSLKLNVTAEGVETEQQRGVLEKLECDTMQGFYFSAPVPAQEIERVLRTFSGSALQAGPALPSQ
mgnify:CR=1 FL=1